MTGHRVEVDVAELMLIVGEGFQQMRDEETVLFDDTAVVLAVRVVGVIINIV